ncbi:MAG: zinc-binding dehydrogenase, partial [Natronomonas sp.]|uniref:zinc-binding dehydrogenase n=1 Tax=Natronomonas sp. TaxID=2184060 RepID=UPI0028703EB9
MDANALGLSQGADNRLPLLESLGIDTFDVEVRDLGDVVESFTDGVGLDVVFDTTGHRSSVETAADHVRKGGQVVVIVGLPGEESELFITQLVRNEVDMNTSYGSTWRNFEQALRLMERGDIDTEEMPNDSFDVDNPETAFEAFLNSETCKSVFKFTGQFSRLATPFASAGTIGERPGVGGSSRAGALTKIIILGRRSGVYEF